VILNLKTMVNQLIVKKTILDGGGQLILIFSKYQISTTK